MANQNEQIKQQVGGMTHEQLLQVIAAIRTPVKTEKELRDEEQLKTDREAMMATLKQAEANRLAKQASCLHMRGNGSTQAVYIQDLNRLYCQACAKWIYPDTDTDLFNRLLPLAIATEPF